MVFFAGEMAWFLGSNDYCQLIFVTSRCKGERTPGLYTTRSLGDSSAEVRFHLRLKAEDDVQLKKMQDIVSSGF